jgi:AcrR family transcriptional regulator
MSHEADLRIRRTHKYLQEAIIELIGEKGFEAITVGDIAERAMINRATFYRHYEDKYDLVAKIFEECVDYLTSCMKEFPKRSGPVDLEHPPDIWVQLFEHFAEHRQLYGAMLGKNGSPWFVARMREYIVKLLVEKEKLWKPSVETRQQTMPNTLADMQLAYVLIGTVVWWLENDMNRTPREIAAWFWQFAFYGYLAARGYITPSQE